MPNRLFLIMKYSFAALLVCASAFAAEFNEPGTFLDPQSAGPDYADQGEYLNDWGGAQVIALGDNKFRLVLYKGGLPGAGWDGERIPGLEGKREGAQIVFAPGENGFKDSVANGVLKIVTPDGNEYQMKKTERTSPAMGAKPPPKAIVLFDGSNTDAWIDPHVDAKRKLIAAGT